MRCSVRIQRRLGRSAGTAKTVPRGLWCSKPFRAAVVSWLLLSTRTSGQWLVSFPEFAIFPWIWDTVVTASPQWLSSAARPAHSDLVVLHGLLVMSCNNNHSEPTAWCCSHTQSVQNSLPFLLTRFVLTNCGSAEWPAHHSWDSSAEELHWCRAENVLHRSKLQFYNLKSKIQNLQTGIQSLKWIWKPKSQNSKSATPTSSNPGNEKTPS